ncbi:ABC transporter ATP-binding protein/permease [Mycobacterium deserti]|uniref:ABC transporter ATP-binding protein/permease n=1 Tax=Mycobacterium deserti TaxID=2978347 RepID=A0ABT2MIA3_9MYCO|nr:ABC transporter ATP-binding protein/permease [Mycobacterium deserti]MCT7661992.1 ABC transporter ATP-binding protein/permease [Mycobacterium deserti]
METFKPSIDWGNELVPSLIWIAKHWAFAMVGVLIVCFLLAVLTKWGRQFWRITGDYFKGRKSLPVWGLFAVLMLSVVAGVRLDVLLSYYGKDVYDAMQIAVQGLSGGDDTVRQSGINGFWLSLLVFAVLATLHVARTMLDIYLLQRFIISWRVWLTDRLTGDWLDHRAYYRGRFIGQTIDNPDQRIQQDVDIFTTGYGQTPNIPSYGTNVPLLFGSVASVLSVISFATILWGLSGPLSLFGYTLPKALFWIVIIYVLVATVIAFWIGRPLIQLSFLNERFNAAFRYALVRLRDTAEAVSFYRGERAERVQLRGRFGETIANYRRYVSRTIGFTGWNLTMSQAINPLPMIIQSGRLFNGEILLGTISQSSTAFTQVHDGLSYFRNAYNDFAAYRAAIIRLHGMVIANESARELPVLATENCIDGTVSLTDVEVRTPDGDLLVRPLDLHLDPGETLVITGASGTGKTTLLRSLAQLWPYTTGHMKCPLENTMFLSQLPYVPLGDLRAVVSYPAEPGTISDEDLQTVLAKVALGHLVIRLNEGQDWSKVLSPGEQQRIAFARVILQKPQAVFMDEATSALDEGLEFTMYELLRRELPQTIVVSVSHRPTVEQHHERELQLLGGGEWRLGRVGGDEPVPV